MGRAVAPAPMVKQEARKAWVRLLCLSPNSSHDHLHRFFFKQQQVIFFFFCGPGGCPLPWLFNIPPANKKGSRQQTSALLNGSKANLDPWIRTANQDRSEMQIKLRINQEAIRKCKSQRKRKYDYRLATK